jgi:hypothetical protein
MPKEAGEKKGSLSTKEAHELANISKTFNTVNALNSKINASPDATAHSKHDILIRCEIGAKPVELSELECLIP